MAENLIDHNPFNVPFVLGELVNMLGDKLEKQPKKAHTHNEVMFFVEEIILHLCNNTEQEMIKRKAMKCLVTHLLFSKN